MGGGNLLDLGGDLVQNGLIIPVLQSLAQQMADVFHLLLLGAPGGHGGAANA